jgi:peptidoglycan/LPS O-acetylase OafA/YrhL
MHFFAYGMKIYDAGQWNGLFKDYSYWPLHDYYLLTPLTLGGVGVALFFVLSGFCIHYSYLRRPDSFSVADFYWRRFLRIYPAYLAALLAFTFLAWKFHYEPFGSVTPIQIITHLLSIQDISPDTLYGISGSYWSLAVEFQFYLAYPLLLIGMRRFTLRGCLLATLAFNVVCQLAVYFSKSGLTNNHGYLWSLPLTTWWSWILGACVAEAYVKGTLVFEQRILITILGFLLWIFACHFRPLEGNNALFGSVVCAALMEAYLKWRQPLMRLERVLIPIGLVSYSLYLWHHPLMQPIYLLLSHTFGFKSRVIEAVLYLPFTFFLLLPLAAGSYYLFELKAPRLIQRFKMGQTTSKESLVNMSSTS